MQTISLFIQTKPAAHPEHDVALQQVKQLLVQPISIKQVFFYYQAVLYAKEPYATLWRALLPSQHFIICSQYAEKYQLDALPAGFGLQGLVSFFAEHAELQSELIQIKSI